MNSLLIEGGTPLFGTVSCSGARNSALKLMACSMFSNEDVILQNVPKIEAVEDDISIITSIGGKAEWAGSGRLVLNGSQISSYEIPEELGSKYRTSLLFAPPLLYRFGKAVIPVYRSNNSRNYPINRIYDVWGSLGITVEEENEKLIINGSSGHSGIVNFKTPSHIATDIAIMSSIFMSGETVINNGSEEPEIDDLIDLSNAMGPVVVRKDPKTITISGVNLFKGAVKEVQPNKTEAVAYAVACLATKGNILIKNIDRAVLIPFANFLTKIGARYEFEQNAFKVWRHDEELNPVSLVVAPTPGFVPDWQSSATLLLTQCSGVSTVHDTVYVDRFGYVKDLNRMGAKIDLVQPSQQGIQAVVSDDSYDLEKSGEPYTVAKIEGPTILKGEKLDIADFSNGPVHILSALTALGRSEISGINIVESYIENFTTKLSSLGAKIWKQ